MQQRGDFKHHSQWIGHAFRRLSLDQILDNAEPSKVAGRFYVGEHFSGFVDIHAIALTFSVKVKGSHMASSVVFHHHT